MGGKNLTEQTFEILKLQSELRGIFIYILYFLKTKLDLESFSSWLNCHVPTTTFSCYNHAWPDYNFNRVLCCQWKMAIIVVIQDYARIFHVQNKTKITSRSRRPKSNYESVHCQSYDFWKIPADCHEISRDSQLVFSETGNRLHSTFIIRWIQIVNFITESLLRSNIYHVFPRPVLFTVLWLVKEGNKPEECIPQFSADKL